LLWETTKAANREARGAYAEIAKKIPGETVVTCASTIGVGMRKTNSVRRHSPAKGAVRATKPVPKSTPRDIDQYLARVPEPARSTLTKLRAMIHSAAPEAAETISYRIPAFRYKGRLLLWFAAFSSHCSLFPTAAVIEAFSKELKGYHISKGTIQFPVDKALPATLVKKLVKARIAQQEQK
jgi:uncharacterized protein YdhG (YjbR/CyaY superfamily)